MNSDASTTVQNSDPEYVPSTIVREDHMTHEGVREFSSTISLPMTQLLLVGSSGRGKSTALRTIREDVAARVDPADTKLFSHQCSDGEHPKHVFQAVLRDLGTEVHVGNKDTWMTWRILTAEMADASFDRVYFFLDGFHRLEQQGEFIDCFVRYSGSIEFGVAKSTDGLVCILSWSQARKADTGRISSDCPN